MATDGALSIALRLSPPAEAAGDGRCLRRLWLFLLAVYLLTMAGRIVSGDGETVYQTTKALVTRARLSIEPRPETAVGRDGRAYGKYGLGQSLVQAPLFVAGHGLGKLLGAVDDRPARFAVGMTNSFVTATLVSLFWLILRELGAGRGPATAAALALGLATLAWPYARADFAEPLQAATLLGAFYCLIRWRRRPALRWAALAGTAAGAACLTKAASVILLPPLAVYFAIALWQRYLSGQWSVASSQRLALTAAAAAAPLALCALLQAALNYYRFGSVSEFGYGDEPATGFRTPLLEGIRNLLISPGKGLFLFAPPVVLGLALLPRFARRHPLEAMVISTVFLAELLYFARWWAWHGDWCWGPRYMVVTVPFLMLAWEPLLAGRLAAGTLLRGFAGLLAAAGLAVAFLGTAVDYGAYYSVVASQLGKGVDVKDARLAPEFSPLLGHAWLAQASAYDAVAGMMASGASRQARDRRENPFLHAYPWAGRHPDLRPEAPERALGFDFWFAALRDRTPFWSYWSALAAWWLALALPALARRLWEAAYAPAARPAPVAAARPRVRMRSALA